MQVDSFLRIVSTITGEGDYYTGVPDSLLKPLCDHLLAIYGVDSRHHIIAANEGNAVGLAAGYHLATGSIPVVYMQNSGEGNIINPLTSLLNDKVYAIPCIFIIGWRGEPGVHDEPQHIFQGEVTESLLSALGVDYCVISERTSEKELHSTVERFDQVLKVGKQVAFIICKNALIAANNIDREKTANEKKWGSKDRIYPKREAIIEKIVEASEDDVIVSTTGKASRELFEIREAKGNGHEKDFLTVGSMGHCSSIALSVASFHPNRRIWCIDGDGAMLMHMGALPVIAQAHPKNMIHVVINNGTHETVGGQPTAAAMINLSAVARDCGYPYAVTVESLAELDHEIAKIKTMSDLAFIEIKSIPGSRANLGRPTSTAIENKKSFMKHLGVY